MLQPTAGGSRWRGSERTEGLETGDGAVCPPDVAAPAWVGTVRPGREALSSRSRWP